MGRRFRSRRRRLKSPNSGYSAESDHDIIMMNQCVSRNFMNKQKKVKLFVFSDSGRGVMALEKVRARDVLLEVPFSLILSVCTLYLDSSFKNIFLSHFLNDICKLTFSCQQLLAFYICFVKLSSSNKIWRTYINTMPNEFSVPYFSDYKNFAEEVIDIVKRQKDEIVQGYRNLINVLFNNKSICFSVEMFTLDMYAWAYFAVNSRCVYLNPDIVSLVTRSLNSKTCHNDFSFLDIINDNPNLGLIPFLDMFNHSPQAKTDVKFEFTSGNNQPVFKLISLTEYSKYDQIFIFYGEHSNFKLFTEYGFCIPSNPYSNISLRSEDIISAANINVSKEKYQYIKKHELGNNLFIDSNGLSYNLVRFLFILNNSDKTTWDSKVYSTVFDDWEIGEMCKLINPLLVTKLCTYRQTLSLECTDDTGILSAYSILIDEYMSLINNVLNVLNMS